MKAEEVQVGDWFEWEADGERYKFRMRREDFSHRDVIESMMPVELTPEILEESGWIFRGGLWVLKDAVRLGWCAKTKELIVGYSAFPRPIKYVHEMQRILRICGLEDRFAFQDTGVVNAFAQIRMMQVGDTAFFPLVKWNACRTTASVLKRRFGARFLVNRTGSSVIVKRIV